MPRIFLLKNFCGERGIRTPGGVTLSGFQDRRNRPLCHLSNPEFCGAKVKHIFETAKYFFSFLLKKIQFLVNESFICNLLHRKSVTFRVFYLVTKPQNFFLAGSKI